MRILTVRLALIASVLVASATPAFAQDARRVEIGSSLVSAVVHVPQGGGSHTTFLGVPSGGIGLVDPALYASIFATPRLAIEPQIAMFAVRHSEGGNDHWFTVFGNVDYFFGDVSKSSPFIFAGGGYLNISGETSFNAIDGGVGYRFRLGDRLTIRAAGRYTHYTKENGNMVSFTLSIGGLLGR